jgi:hypothetical protein
MADVVDCLLSTVHEQVDKPCDWQPILDQIERIHAGIARVSDICFPP